MIKWLFYWKHVGPRYIWFFPRKWIKWIGLRPIAVVNTRRNL
jgi:hypothetical protein